MEKELRNYLYVIGFNNITIKDFYNGFIMKPKGCTKQEVTKCLSIVCKKIGYNLLKPKSLGNRVYVFEKRINIIHSEVTIEKLLELQPEEFLTLQSDSDILEIKKIIKKSMYVTNNRFKIKNCQDGLTRIFRIS